MSGKRGNNLEERLKEFQWTRVTESVREKSKLNDNGVVIADGVIKLHENDSRRGIREKWLERINVKFPMSNVKSNPN